MSCARARDGARRRMPCRRCGKVWNVSWSTERVASLYVCPKCVAREKEERNGKKIQDS